MERLTFAGIEKKTHPLFSNYLGTVFDNREVVDDNDNEIVQDIIDIHRQFVTSKYSASGEWNWIQENKQKDYKRLLSEGNQDALTNMLRNFFRNQISFGISAPDLNGAFDRYRLVNDILLDIDTWIEFCKNPPPFTAECALDR